MSMQAVQPSGQRAPGVQEAQPQPPRHLYRLVPVEVDIATGLARVEPGETLVMLANPEPAVTGVGHASAFAAPSPRSTFGPVAETLVALFDAGLAPSPGAHLGLGSGFESPDLDRPVRQPHQQGVCEARLGPGYRDGSPPKRTPGHELERVQGLPGAFAATNPRSAFCGAVARSQLVHAAHTDPCLAVGQLAEQAGNAGPALHGRADGLGHQQHSISHGPVAPQLDFAADMQARNGALAAANNIAVWPHVRTRPKFAEGAVGANMSFMLPDGTMHTVDGATAMQAPAITPHALAQVVMPAASAGPVLPPPGVVGGVAGMPVPRGFDGKANPFSSMMAPRRVKPASSKRQQLTVEEAAEIYSLRPRRGERSGGMMHCRTLAPKFGVTPKTVRDVWSGRTWAEATRHLWTPEEISQRKHMRSERPSAKAESRSSDDGDDDMPAV